MTQVPVCLPPHRALGQLNPWIWGLALFIGTGLAASLMTPPIARVVLTQGQQDDTALRRKIIRWTLAVCWIACAIAGVLIGWLIAAKGLGLVPSGDRCVVLRLGLVVIGPLRPISVFRISADPVNRQTPADARAARRRRSRRHGPGCTPPPRPSHLRSPPVPFPGIRSRPAGACPARSPCVVE